MALSRPGTADRLEAFTAGSMGRLAANSAQKVQAQARLGRPTYDAEAAHSPFRVLQGGAVTLDRDSAGHVVGCHTREDLQQRDGRSRIAEGGTSSWRTHGVSPSTSVAEALSDRRFAVNRRLMDSASQSRCIRNVPTGVANQDLCPIPLPQGTTRSN